MLLLQVSYLLKLSQKKFTLTFFWTTVILVFFSRASSILFTSFSEQGFCTSCCTIFPVLKFTPWFNPSDELCFTSINAKNSSVLSKTSIFSLSSLATVFLSPLHSSLSQNILFSSIWNFSGSNNFRPASSSEQEIVTSCFTNFSVFKLTVWFNLYITMGITSTTRSSSPSTIALFSSLSMAFLFSSINTFLCHPSWLFSSSILLLLFKRRIISYWFIIKLSELFLKSI